MENKVALVTGAGIGIGRGIAIELAKAGYNVAINYNSSRAEAEEVCKLINSMGVKSVMLQADLSKVDETVKMFNELRNEFDRLDLFVNNSGITMKSPFLETTEEIFDKMCDLNFKGAYFCVQQAAKYMVEKNIPGNIIIISSNHYKAHFDDVSVYGSVKAGLTKFAEHAAKELAKYKIRVNVIAPGWTDTGAPRMAPKESTYHKIPLKRWCTPEEIGKAVLYLTSDYAASITGACLIIDGGAVLV